MEFGCNPSTWVSAIPFGLGQQKPKHFRDMARVWWKNRGVLGTTRIHDFTLDGIHLCSVRLELLRLHTMPALDPATLSEGD